MRVSGVSGLCLYKNKNGMDYSNKQNCRISNPKEIRSYGISFEANPFKFKNKALKNAAIFAIVVAPAAPVFLGVAMGAYVADKMLDENENTKTNKGDKK